MPNYTYRNQVIPFEHDQVIALPLSLVTPDPTQPRKKFSREPLEGLAASIAREGLLQPITVRHDGNRFIIITGERRYRASCMAKTGTIRALVQPERDAGEVLRKQVLENMVREDMNPIEEAEGMKRLLDAGYSLDEVGRTVGKKPATIERDLDLLKLAPEVRHMLTASPEQRMGKRLAYELVKLSHGSQRAVLRKIGGKTFSKQKAIIQALYLQENQIDLFGQAAMGTNGNRLKALQRKWEMFKLNCKGLNKLAESDLRALVTMMEGNVAHNLAAIEGTLRTLTRLRDHVHVFAGMKKGRAA